jgi:O-antigen/teichoic acid export membrane protein
MTLTANPHGLGPQPARMKNAGVKAVLSTIVSKVGILAVNAATGILTARTLKPQGRGELAAMILWPLLVAFITTLGIPSSLIFMLRRNPDDETQHIANGLFMTLLLGIAAGLIAAALIPFWLRREYSHNVIVNAQMFLLIATPLLALTSTGRAVIEAKGLFSYSNHLQLLYPTLTLVDLLLLLAVHKMSPTTAGLAYMVPALPCFLLMAYRVWPLVRQRWHIHFNACRALLNYGIRSYGVDLLGTLALQVDQVLVISLLSPSDMGRYGVVLSLSRMFNLFQASVVMILFPKASGRSAEDVLPLVALSARAGTLATAVCAAIVALVGSRLLGIVYGREYAGSSRCLQLLLVEVTVSGLVFILAQAFMALGRPGVVSILQGIGLSLSVPLMLILVPRFGLVGAALSLLLSTTARLIFVMAGFKLFLKQPRPNLIPQLRDFEVLLSRLPRRFSPSRA